LPVQVDRPARGPNYGCMRIGTSLFLIAVGAILKYAVHERIAGVRVHTAGLVLMIVGIVGLAISVFLLLRTVRAGPPPPAEL
jgi:hypothetical protein